MRLHLGRRTDRHDVACDVSDVTGMTLHVSDVISSRPQTGPQLHRLHVRSSLREGYGCRRHQRIGVVVSCANVRILSGGGDDLFGFSMWEINMFVVSFS